MLSKLRDHGFCPGQPALHDPDAITVAHTSLKSRRCLRPKDFQTERHVLFSSFFGEHQGSKLRKYRNEAAQAFVSAVPVCHQSRGSRPSAFFEDGYQASSNQRIRSDENLQRAQGQKNVKLEDQSPEASKVPDPVEETTDTGEVYKSQEEKLLQRIHDDEEQVVELVVAQKAAAKQEARAEQAARAAEARRAAMAAHASVSQTPRPRARGRMPHNEQLCRKRKSPLECQDLRAECAWKGDETTGTCHHKAREQWPSGTDFLFGIGEVALLESLVIGTAVVTRLRGRDFLRQFVDNPGYNLRSSMWYFPTVLMYFATGLYYYTRTQGWNPEDTLYFLVQVVSTVGDNDMEPIQPVPKVFTLCHVLLGLLLVGGAVGEEVDEILRSRVLRMGNAVARGADFQDLLPILWRVAAEARDAAGSREVFQSLVERLEGMPQHPRELRPTAEQLRWLREVRGGEVLLAELSGAGALIPWPQRSTLWTGAGWRIKALLPLLRYVLQNPSGPMPSYDPDWDCFKQSHVIAAFSMYHALYLEDALSKHLAS